MNHSFADLKDAVCSDPPFLAVVLGSGLSDLAQRLRRVISVSYSDITGMPATSVAGHEGRLLYGYIGEQPVLFFQGRFHRYEGHSWDAVLRPIGLAHNLGAGQLLVTNAAGGIRDDLAPGSIMLLDGALNWTDTKFGRMSKPERNLFDETLTGKLRTAAQDLSMNLPAGVYAQMLGPCYETPAEIRALRYCGADAVGMSTVREVVAAKSLGMKCAAMSLITNQAAGLGATPLDHGEVLATAARRKDRLIELLERFVRVL